MPDHIIDISYESPKWQSRQGDISCEDIVKQTALLAIEAGFAYLGKSDNSSEISIVLADDDFVQTLNKTYRDKDKPTNVLSFPQTEQDEFDDAMGEISLGDVIIAYDVIDREAKEQSKDFYDHLRHMLVHGTLHLMHFDHLDDDQAEEMEALEVVILCKMGIKNPYEIA